MMTLRPSTQLPESASNQMYSMRNAHFLVQALLVAATLRIADLLVDGPQTVEELAQASEDHAPSLYRLLRMLASVDVYNEECAGSLQANAPGCYLVQRQPRLRARLGAFYCFTARMGRLGRPAAQHPDWRVGV